MTFSDISPTSLRSVKTTYLTSKRKYVQLIFYQCRTSTVLRNVKNGRPRQYIKPRIFQLLPTKPTMQLILQAITFCLLFVASAWGQASHIGLPTAGTTLQIGQTFTFQVVRPVSTDSLTASFSVVLNLVSSEQYPGFHRSWDSHRDSLLSSLADAYLPISRRPARHDFIYWPIRS
jgi:hypothetical protein